MRAVHQRWTSITWLAAALMGTACTATVDEDPFATVGMSGGTAGTGTGSGPTSDGSGSGSDGGSTADPDDDGSTSDSDDSDAADSTDDTTTGEDCNPPCDPMTAICEQGECVPPGPPVAGDVVISELMPNPNMVTDDEGEWVELTNVSAGPVNLEGCVLYDSGSDEDVIDSGVPIVVPPGGTAILAKVTDMAINGGIAGVVYEFGGSYNLGNMDDEVRLECGGAVVDEVVYLEAWHFGAGVSIQLDSGSLDATANDDVANWCGGVAAYGLGDLGTPGAGNAGC